MSAMWYVYMIKCSDGSLYTGVTTDIERRMNEHNSGKGASYTRVRTPVRLVHHESRPDRSKALKREAEIKRWPRSKKLTLIKKDHD
ncbi:MAG: GIY-YIG nuclease family protein [Candidatus Omnitrophota bacterium]|nr:GIY-YIG nuclease family protein [Candidatus Omnitrophota bacterium]